MNLRKILFISVVIILSFLNVYAQEYPALTGAIIGTEKCVDYDRGNIETSEVNTATNLFDGDLTNMFATYQRSGGWAGLDLGEKHIITGVAYCPRKGWSTRVQLGLFEGANQPDFGDAVPLFLIPDQPKDMQMTYQDIDCSRGFRYVRYVGPNDVRCNIAEIAFYGYKGEGDDSQLIQLTNLPTVTIQTVDNKDILVKEVFIRGYITVISDGGKTIHVDSLQIRGRGNMSWNFPKKPYRFKLDNSARLAGMPAKKKRWTLINNYGDKTLMRNLLAFDLSERLEMTYTPAGKAVDLILNGEYKGNYQLCDQIEVNGGRVEVEEMLPSDISLPNLSGGYLLEVDAYANEGTSWFTSSRGTPVTIKYPKDDEIVSAQKQYIRNHYNKMEAALHGQNYKDLITGYRKYFDVASFVRHFLVGEISGDTDTYWSTYLFKYRNDDIFYWGPVWDFDIAYENDDRTYKINSSSNWIYKKGSEANGMKSFVDRLFTDQAFAQEVKDTYHYYRNKGILSEEALTEVIDNYEEELNSSQKLNFTRWDIMGNKVHQNPRIWGSYKAEVENVRDYVIKRIQWVDNKLGYDPTAVDNNALGGLRIWTSEGILNISDISQTMEVRVVDLSGKVIYMQQLDSDVSIELERGVYLIQVIDSEGRSETVKRLIK